MIKRVWGGLVSAPPTDFVVQGHISDMARLHANGTDRASFYRQLLAQFENPLLTGQRRALWLDREVALSLKGTASLALYPDREASPTATATAGADAGVSVGEGGGEPHLVSSSSSRHVLGVSRGIRLSAPLATDSMMQVTHTMQACAYTSTHEHQ